MKKLIVLSFLILVGSAQADVASKIDPYLNKYGRRAGDEIEKRFDKKMEEEVYKPLEQKNKELQKVRDENKKLLQKNAENAALALWAKIKGWFRRK